MDLSTIKSTGNWGNSASRLNENFSKIKVEIEKLKYFSKNPFVGYFDTEVNLPARTEPAWALVGDLATAKPYAYYVAENAPDGYSEGWNDLSSVLGTYDFTSLKKYATLQALYTACKFGIMEFEEDFRYKANDSNSFVYPVRSGEQLKIELFLNTSNYYLEISLIRKDNTSFTIKTIEAADNTGTVSFEYVPQSDYRGVNVFFGNAAVANTGTIHLTSTVPNTLDLEKKFNSDRIINVTDEYPLADGQYYTSQTAKRAIPVERRKRGLIIKYRDTIDTWCLEMNTTNNPANEDSWLNEGFWAKFVSKSVISNGLFWLEWKGNNADTRRQLNNADRKIGVSVAYYNGNKIVKETYTGGTYTEDGSWTDFSGGSTGGEYISAEAFGYGYAVNSNKPSLWEQGHFTDDGQKGSSTAAYYPLSLRTKSYIPIAEIDKIVALQGYVFWVYKYQKDGTFVSYSTKQTEYSDFDDGYEYRIQMRNVGQTAIAPSESPNILFLYKEIGGSPYKRDNIDFGSTNVGGYYKGLQKDYSMFNASTLTSEVYSAFDALSQGHPEYITKTDLGTASDDQHIYLYDFNPTRVNYEKLIKKIPKILIMAAQHGFEKSSVYGDYYFLKDMLENWEANPILDYLRHHVRIMVIPVINPWGFDNNEYKNANGVNLNRNYYDENWVKGTDPSSSQYGGEEPFDQPETQIVRNFAMQNKDAFFFMDHHTNGSSAVTSYEDINWHSSFDGDNYFYRMHDASNYHICNITAHFNKDYSLGISDGTLCGRMNFGPGSGTGTFDVWAAKYGKILSMTFEGFNGFPGRAAYSEEEKKANSELIGNYLMALINQYKV